METASNVKWKNANMAMCNWFLSKMNIINFDFDRNYHISHNTYSAVIQYNNFIVHYYSKINKIIVHYRINKYNGT